MANILIVEDDISLNKGIAMALKDDKYSFFQAFDIASAKELIKNMTFDLIIL